MSIQVSEMSAGVQQTCFISKDTVGILDRAQNIRIIELSQETPLQKNRL